MNHFLQNLLLMKLLSTKLFRFKLKKCVNKLITLYYNNNKTARHAETNARGLSLIVKNFAGVFKVTCIIQFCP